MNTDPILRKKLILNYYLLLLPQLAQLTGDNSLFTFPVLQKVQFSDIAVTKKLEIFGGHLLSEDDHSHWAPPYWNITKETSSLGRTEA